MQDYVRNRITAVVLLMFTGAMWYFSADIAAESQMFPRLIMVPLAILSSVMLIQSFLPMFRSTRIRPFFVKPANLLASLVGIFVYILAVQWLGYFTSSVVFIPVFAYVLGERSWTMLGVSTILFLLMIYLVFVVAFERPVPIEIWFD